MFDVKVVRLTLESLLFHATCVVFSAAISALIIMTLLSVFLGMATTVIPKTVTHVLSIVLFFVFGVKMLREGYTMTEEESREEFEEVQLTLSKRESRDVEYSMNGSPDHLSAQDPETGVIR